VRFVCIKLRIRSHLPDLLQRCSCSWESTF